MLTKFIPLTVTILAWSIGAYVVYFGWSEFYVSLTHDSVGLLPSGMLAITCAVTGVGIGLLGNGLAFATSILTKEHTK